MSLSFSLFIQSMSVFAKCNKDFQDLFNIWYFPEYTDYLIADASSRIQRLAPHSIVLSISDMQQDSRRSFNTLYFLKSMNESTAVASSDMQRRPV